MNTNLVFLLNLLATWYLVGLIWLVQVVHYNMFDRVGSDGFVRYEADHNRLITPIVAPPMLIELATACLLLTSAPPAFPRWAADSGRDIASCECRQSNHDKGIMSQINNTSITGKKMSGKKINRAQSSFFLCEQGKANLFRSSFFCRTSFCRCPGTSLGACHAPDSAS